MVEVTQQKPAREEGADSPIWIVFLLASVVVLTIIGIKMSKTEDDFSNWIRLLGLLATISIFTILYKDNPIFRFVEHIFIGLATGFSLIYMWEVLVKPKWFIPMMPADVIKGGQGHWWLFPALLIGLLFFTIYIPKFAWMNRFAITVFMGWAAGNELSAFIGGIGPQMVAVFKSSPITAYRPEVVAFGNGIHFKFFGVDLWFNLLWLIGLIVLTTVMAYFFFSIDHKRGWIRRPATVGRYFLMVTLGAIFGTTVMGRFSLLIERFDYIISTFKGWFL